MQRARFFRPRFITRPDGPAAIHPESTVAPIHHVFDDNIDNFTFFFEHFEHFIAEQCFQLSCIWQWADRECVVIVEAAIGGNNMQMRIEDLKIAKLCTAIAAPGWASSQAAACVRYKRKTFHAHRLSLVNNLRSSKMK